ncbi:protein CASPARIAN STRIP INTEGRITY FACTOR 1-like [Nymphaea colorata]|nr:protein CASPARIAN STRIP INTEGRITY FACTOR 1-like [Nymphaea colorata]
MTGSMALRGVITLIFFVLVSSSFLLPYAGGRPIFITELAAEITEVEEEALSAGSQHDGSDGIHQRMLRVKTNDYGSYDPSPTFVRPPFKLIPN